MAKKRVKKGDKTTPVLNNKKRRLHSVYCDDEEWNIISRKADALDMERSVYIREVSLGYKPTVPDREFRRQMMAIRDDILKHFQFLKSMNLTTEKRRQIISETGFQKYWTTCVKKELDFLNMWIKRL